MVPTLGRSRKRSSSRSGRRANGRPLLDRPPVGRGGPGFFAGVVFGSGEVMRRRTDCPRDFGAFHVFTFTEDCCRCGWDRFKGPPPVTPATKKED